MAIKIAHISDLHISEKPRRGRAMDCEWLSGPSGEGVPCPFGAEPDNYLPAVGPWQTGEPPKNGTAILGIWETSGGDEMYVASWVEDSRMLFWCDESCSKISDNDPVKYARINIPGAQ